MEEREATMIPRQHRSNRIGEGFIRFTICSFTLCQTNMEAKKGPSVDSCHL